MLIITKNINIFNIYILTLLYLFFMVDIIIDITPSTVIISEYSIRFLNRVLVIIFINNLYSDGMMVPNINLISNVGNNIIKPDTKKDIPILFRLLVVFLFVMKIRAINISVNIIPYIR